MLSLPSAIAAARIDERGFWYLGSRQLQIGIVVFVGTPDTFLVIKKAPVPGYEFSGHLALPGGMVRGHGAMGVEYAIRESAK